MSTHPLSSPSTATRRRTRLSAALLLSLAAGTLSSTAFAARECESADYQPSAGQCARLPGVELFYYDTGPAAKSNGQTIVLLHAASGNADAFKHNVDALAQAGYRVVAYDRRNVGRSSNTLRDDALGRSHGSLVDDLHALTQHLGLERFHLLGVAAGAQVAAQYAASHPERVDNVIYAATLGPIGLPAQEPTFGQLRANIELPFEVFCPTTLDLPPPAPLRVNRTVTGNTVEIPAVTLEHRELGTTFRVMDRPGVADFLSIQDNGRQHEAGSCPRVLVGKNQPGLAADAPNNPNAYDKIARLLTQRTLLLAGTGDAFYSPPILMQTWGQHLPNARYAQMDTGHAPQFEQPAQFNEIVLRFLGGDDSFPRVPAVGQPAVAAPAPQKQG